MTAMKLADYLIESPLYGFGRQAGAQGSSTAPVQSPLEGLARALQGAAGGFFQGQAIREAKGEQRSDQEALAKAMELYAADPAGARKILASRPNLSDTAATLLASDVGFQRQVDLLKAKDKLEQDAQARDLGMFFPGAQTGGAGTQVAGAPPNRDAFIAAMTPHVQAISQATGLDPRLVMAQTALETGWGARAPGNNYFGIKGGDGPPLQTTEAGPNGTLVPTQAQFRSYPDAGASAKDYVDFVKGNQGRYAPVLQAQGLDAQIDAMAKSGYATDPQYGAKLRQIAQTLPQGQGVQPSPGAAQNVPGGLPQPLAQGSTPQVAPGQPAQPQQGQSQTAANVPNGDTIQFQGLELPRAAIASAMMIRDAKERQGKLTDIVREAVKSAKGPDAGTPAGDVHVLDRALKDPSFASSPEYVAAFNRASEPKMSQQGQLMYPDMSAYPRPVLPQGQPTNSGQPRFEDTPSSRFQMAGKLADDFNQLKSVKDYREVVPIVQSMQEAATRNNRVADLNLVYGLAKIMDPTSVVREGEQIMVRNAQSLPDWVKGMISAVNGGSQFPPEQRARILAEAESRVGAYKQQYDAIAQQFEERARRYGLDPRDVLTTPGGAQTQQQAAPQGERPIYDVNGKRIK